jgi:hypothetical protein
MLGNAYPAGVFLRDATFRAAARHLPDLATGKSSKRLRLS